MSTQDVNDVEAQERARRVVIMRQRLEEGYDMWGGEIKLTDYDHKWLLASFDDDSKKRKSRRKNK